MSPKPLRTYRLELDFRRAVRRVPRRDRPALLNYLRHRHPSTRLFIHINASSTYRHG